MALSIIFSPLLLSFFLFFSLLQPLTFATQKVSSHILLFSVCDHIVPLLLILQNGVVFFFYAFMNFQ
jgi:hypothetical protein